VCWIALTIHQKGREVPSDILGAILIWERLLEKGVRRHGIFAVDVSLGEPIELLVSTIVLAGELEDLLISSRFLTGKLIAGESKDFESLRVVLVVKLNELGIVCVCQTSFGGNVDDTEH